MTDFVYDQLGDFYFDFVRAALDDPYSVIALTRQRVLALAEPLAGQDVCDLACGEGHLARALAAQGARVTGVDLSQNLLAHARQQLSVQPTSALPITYLHDDVQNAVMLEDAAFDWVVCNMALMDIPDLDATIGTVARILRPGGRFVASLLHPCFETPFQLPEESPLELDEEGNFVAYRVTHYAGEGHWRSGGDGMRGTHGAYHRRLETYLNTLLRHGLGLNHVEEPLLPLGDYAEMAHQRAAEIPRTLLWVAQRNV